MTQVPNTGNYSGRDPTNRSSPSVSELPSMAVSIRSMHLVRYMGSASNGLWGMEASWPRSHSRVSVGGREPRFQSSRRSLKSINSTPALLV